MQLKRTLHVFIHGSWGHFYSATETNKLNKTKGEFYLVNSRDRIIKCICSFFFNPRNLLQINKNTLLQKKTPQNLLYIFFI